MCEALRLGCKIFTPHRCPCIMLIIVDKKSLGLSFAQSKRAEFQDMVETLEP